MDMNTMLVDPTAPVRPQTAGETFRLGSLRGQVVGFIDNAKPNFNHLAAAIGELLLARHGVARTVTHRKRAASLPVADEALQSLTAECDLVIAGSGD